MGLLANAHKLSHLGLSYVVRRSTFSEANQRRSSKVFGDIPIIKRTDSPFIIREDIKNRLRQYNKNLERILELCGMEQKLTSYVSRHSWATIAKKSGIEIGIISDALGHNDISITRTYLDCFGNEEVDKANDSITNYKIEALNVDFRALLNLFNSFPFFF